MASQEQRYAVGRVLRSANALRSASANGFNNPHIPAPPDLTSPIDKRRQMNDVLVFQQDGDVLIEIDNQKLLVSSELLSSISPVFRVMLSGGFKEGIKIPFGSHTVHRVSLPEDNIDAVLLLCKILHGREDLITKTPDGLCLFGLMVLCDKYQCTEAMHKQIDIWILKSLGKYGVHDKQHACTLLLAAFINDSYEAFNRVSERILRYFREGRVKKRDRASWYWLMYHPLANGGFFTSFESRHIHINYQIDVAFSRPFEDLKRCVCFNSASVRAKKAASFTEQLFQADLMPSDIKRLSVTDIIERIDRLPDVLCRHFKKCPLPTETLKEILQRHMDEVFRYLGNGLFLHCLKINGACLQYCPCRYDRSWIEE